MWGMLLFAQDIVCAIVSQNDLKNVDTLHNNICGCLF